MKGRKLYPDGVYRSPNWIDLRGRVFERLTVEVEDKSKSGKARWKCVCVCGGTAFADTNTLTSGHKRSCGCLMREAQAAPKPYKRTHGMSKHPVRAVWSTMLARCRNSKNNSYKRYGARGITVCDFLAETPQNVIDLLGERPEKMEIDRINNDGHYSCGKCPDCLARQLPLNVRWLSHTGQLRNYSKNLNYTIDGVTRCLKEWAQVLGINYHTLYHRMELGWHQEEMFKPVGHKRTINA